MNKTFLFSLLFFFSTISLTYSQLSGTKTIPGDYANIKTAVASLNSVGVGSGGVIFNIAAGHYERSANIILTATGTASNPVVFRKSGSGSNPLITASAGNNTQTDGILILSGSDYVTIEGIDFKDTTANTTDNAKMEWGIAVLKSSASDGARNVTIKNCNISLFKGYTAAYGIYVNNHTPSSVTPLTISSVSGINSFIRLIKNNITNSYNGIYVRGYNHTSSPYNLLDQNNEIGILDSGNVVTGFAGAGTQSWGIYTYAQNNLKIVNNIVISDTGTTATLDGIYVGSALNANTDITHNSITVYSSAASSQLNGIRNFSGGSGTSNTVNISYNQISGCSYSSATTGILYLIYNDNSNGNAKSLNISNNYLFNNTHAGTGSFYCIEAFSPSELTISGNLIYNNSKTGSRGNLFCIKATPSVSFICSNNNIYDNTIPNTSGSTSTANIYGIYHDNSSASLTSETISGNNIYGLLIGGFISSPSTLTAIHSNTSSASQSQKNIFSNNINNLTISNSGGGTLNGIYHNYSGLCRIYKNNIYKLSAGASSGNVNGIYADGGKKNFIYNNFISDLRTPSSIGPNALNGIYINGSAGDTAGVYFNTVFLNGSSTGTNFGSNSINSTITPLLDLRNNILCNLSTPNGTGKTITFRRSSPGFGTYATVSDNNCFYAGSPSASNLIFYDGTNQDQTISAFKSRVTPRDANSFSELPPFVNIATTPYDLHIYFDPDTKIIYGGNPVSVPVSVSDDYDGNARDITTPFTGADELLPSPQKTLSLHLLFEGLYNSSTGKMIPDTVKIFVRNPVTPYSIVESVSAITDSSGNILAPLTLISDKNNYFISVTHRNGLETWSKNPLQAKVSVLGYDFTKSADKAFGNNLIQKAGKWCIYSGDVNRDGQITLDDLLQVDSDNQTFSTGYLATDINGDGQVTLDDLLITDSNNQNFISVQKP